MAQVHTLGTFYWHTMNVPARGPLITHDFTYEIDPPYRVGRSWILRRPRSGVCLVVGHWFATLDEEQALMLAPRARVIDLSEAIHV